MSNSMKRAAPSTDEGGSAAAGASAKRRPESTLGEVFSPELLRLYYSRVFPGAQMFKWLCYGHDPKVDRPHVDKSFMSKREFSFTIENDIYIRYLSFRDEEDMVKQIQARQPHKIDIGAIYTHPPKDHHTITANAFRPVGRELVFDVDLTDYDDVRTCCSGASICGKCWPLMTVALRIVNTALKEDFGFKHMFWVYSGRRGIHCWVCDKRAVDLTDSQRAAVVDNLSAVTGGEHQRRKVKLASSVYPAFSRALEELRPHFLENTIAEEGQRFLCEPELWNRVLALLPEVPGLREDLADRFATRCKTPQERWNLLKSETEKQSQNKELDGMLRAELRTCADEIVMTFTYPRLDVNVSKARNHLLKSPFCAHPKTGRVCVPMTVETCGQFDPWSVPTLADLNDQINDFDKANPGSQAKDLDKTALASYVKTFETKFLDPLYSSIRADVRVKAEAQAATTGDW